MPFPSLTKQAALPAGLAAAFATPIVSRWTDPDSPASTPELVVVILMLGVIVALSAAIVSFTYTQGDAASAPKIAARRFIPWAATIAVGICRHHPVVADVETRAITLPTGDQTAQVLIGPRDAITAALAEGLIAHREAAAAMESGKAFEERAFEEMTEE